MSGWKEWEFLERVTSAEFQSYLQDQVVQVYANTTARSSALGTAVSEGMISYLADTNAIQFYDGSAWASISNPGDITAVTAGTGLTGGGASGDVTLNVNLAAITATGIPTFLSNPTSANLAAAVTNETGSGNLVFSSIASMDRTTLNAPRFATTSTATSGGTTALSASGSYYNIFTGTSAQTVTLPNTVDTVVGTSWVVINNSTGNLTIRTSTAAFVFTVTAGTAVLVHCISVTDRTLAASYNTEIIGYSTERVAQTNGVVTTATAGSAVVRNITLSTATPSGGMDGDVWLQHTP